MQILKQNLSTNTTIKRQFFRKLGGKNNEQNNY